MYTVSKVSLRPRSETLILNMSFGIATHAWRARLAELSQRVSKREVIDTPKRWSERAYNEPDGVSYPVLDHHVLARYEG
jgi:hypothetical protein